LLLCFRSLGCFVFPCVIHTLGWRDFQDFFVIAACITSKTKDWCPLTTLSKYQVEISTFLDSILTLRVKVFLFTKIKISSKSHHLYSQIGKIETEKDEILIRNFWKVVKRTTIFEF
jgi:hypothetical protein